MKYIEVEREDLTNRRREYEQIMFDTDRDMEDVMSDPHLVDAFMVFVDRGIKPDWDERTIEQYAAKCNWYFCEITEDEYELGGCHRRRR